MKPGQRSEPAAARSDRVLAKQARLRKVVEKLESDPAYRPGNLKDDEYSWVLREVARRAGEHVGKKTLDRAFQATLPFVSAPVQDDRIADLPLIFNQPAVRSLWSDWEVPRGERGPKPDFTGAKALMWLMGSSGVSAHLRQNYKVLEARPDLQEFFAGLSMERQLDEAVGSTSVFEAPKLRLHAEQSMSLEFTRLAEAAWTEIEAPEGSDGHEFRRVNRFMRAAVQLIRALRELHPDAGIGERILIDGTAVPAWALQVGAAQGTVRDQRLRKRCPNAHFRAYVRTKEGKRDIKPGDKLKSGLYASRGKAWRGYFLVALVDQATGLPLVWTLMSAKEDEAGALHELLEDLYVLWPDCPARFIAGDSAWDEDEWCRLLLQDYGIVPLFRLHDPRTRKLDEGERGRTGKVASLDERGRLVCAAHGKPLDFAGADTPARSATPPGQRSVGDCRVRAVCRHEPDPCGQLTLAMDVDWSRLGPYPHYPEGNPGRYAYRLGLLARLSQVESLWSRLKVGLKLTGKGADRTRIFNWDVVHTLISIGMVSFCAATLADQQLQQGLSPAPERESPEAPARDEPLTDRDAEREPPASCPAGESVEPDEATDADAMRAAPRAHAAARGESDRRPCPECAEDIKIAARRCRFCGVRFAEPNGQLVLG